MPPDTNWRGNVDERKLIGDYARHSDGKCHVLDEPEIECEVFDPPGGYSGKVKPYPYSFDPTFHRYKLDEPQKWKKPRNIFVCSMADLFGDWVPDEWIRQVFEACKKAPQHRYLFLTKNPTRYCKIADAGWLPDEKNFWYGSTITRKGDPFFAGSIHWNAFVSIEPLLKPLDVGIGSFGGAKWAIIGAETGNRKGKITPKREWVENIVDATQITDVKVFMKESLREIMGDDFQQEFPWEK